MTNKVSGAVAEFFMNQCVGESNGHMALIPNNPVLYGLCKAHGVETPKDFAAFLQDIVNNIDREGEVS